MAVELLRRAGPVGAVYELLLTCPKCGARVPGNRTFGAGVQGVMIGSSTRCPHCGSIVPIPDGFYDFGEIERRIVQAIQDASDPAKAAASVKASIEAAKRQQNPSPLEANPIITRAGVSALLAGMTWWAKFAFFDILIAVVGDLVSRGAEDRIYPPPSAPAPTQAAPAPAKAVSEILATAFVFEGLDVEQVPPAHVNVLLVAAADVRRTLPGARLYLSREPGGYRIVADPGPNRGDLPARVARFKQAWSRREPIQGDPPVEVVIAS